MKFSNHKRGFSIAELIVVGAIISILSSVILTGQVRYGDKAATFERAYKISSDIKRAQTEALAAKKWPCTLPGVPDSFDVNIGVSFSVSNLNQYNYFADLSPDRIFTSSELNTPCSYETFSTKIYKICVDRPSGSSKICMPDNPNFTQVNIIFNRPDPRPDIYFGCGASVSPCGGVNIRTPIYLYFADSKGGSYVELKYDKGGQVAIKSVGSTP